MNKNERSFRLLLEQRQSTAQKSISQLMPLLLKPEKDGRSSLIASLRHVNRPKAKRSEASRHRKVLSSLEDELSLLDQHYERLLHEREIASCSETKVHLQNLVNIVVEEMKDKCGQIEAVKVKLAAAASKSFG